MANQPKKYTKFVAAAATATLVASAIVPVASAAGFSDVADTNSHAVNINALAEAGIIGGYPDGTFKPNQELTRGQVVKMLGKWVEAQGFEIPADYATKARFTDLAADAKDQELVKYAALVFDTGVFAGSNGALNAGGKITRENMALVLDRAFKAINDTTLVEVAAEIEDVKVADLATAKAEAREAIQALRNLGISGVENFMPKDSVTRAQFATFLNKTIKTEAAPVELTVKEAVAVDANTVEVTLSDDKKHTVKLEKALEANKATEIKFTIDEKEYTAEVTYVLEVKSAVAVDATTLEVVLSDDKKHTVKLEKALEANKATEVTFTINEVEFKATVTYVVEKLEVVSVNAVNATQVEVKFSQEIDATTANAKDNYVVNGTVLSSVDPSATAVLQEDNKTVVVTFSTSQNGKSFNFKVDGVKSKDLSETITSEQFAVTVKDTVAPSVSKVEYVGSDIIISFTEPVANPTTVIARVGGKPVTAVAGTKSNEVKLTAANLATAGVNLTENESASVYVAGAKDTVNNVMALYNGTVTKPSADKVKPAIVSLTQVSQDTVRIVFSEVLTDELTDGEVSVLKGASVLTHDAVSNTNPKITVTKNTTVDSTGKTYDVELNLDGTTAGDGIYATDSSEQALTFLIAAGSVGDAATNTNDAYTKTLTMVKDATAPVLTSSKVNAGKTQFELEFNENITAGTLSNMVVTDSKGVRFPVITGSGSTEVSGKVLKVDFVADAGVIANGTYTVKVPAGTVTDAYGNKNAEFTTTFTVGDTADKAKPVAAITNNGNNVFRVTFNNDVTGTADEVSAETALNLANYQLDGAALPAGTDIYFTSSARNVVEIVLPTNSINIGDTTNGTNAVLTVSNVKDLAGNVVDTTSTSVKVADNTAAKLVSAKLLGDTLALTFDENLGNFTADDIADVIAELEIKGGTTALTDGSADALVATVSGKTLTITVTAADNSNWAAIKASSTITVEVDGPVNLKDVNGLLVKDAVKVTVEK